MKCKTIIDPACEEQVVIYAHEKTALVDKIERLVAEDPLQLIGYKEKTAVFLDIAAICCFVTENNKVYAHTAAEKLLLKSRLYQLEQTLPQNFIKINQSCIANIQKIERFDASFSGTLRVIFKNGYTDYVSRRNLKTIKERLEL